MASFNFPTNPINDDTYSLNGVTYKYVAAKQRWDIVPTPHNFETTTQLNTRDTNNRVRANHTGTQTAATISDFDTEVSNNTDVAANTSARHSAVTVTDSSTIDFTLTGQNITAGIVAGSVGTTQLSAGVNTSLGKADGSVQLTGNQTIAGVKTFSADLIVNGHTVGRGSGGFQSNVAIGTSAMINNVTGTQSVAIGDGALSSFSSGYNNVVIGYGSGGSITSHGNNVCIGTQSFQQGTGFDNVGLGMWTLRFNAGSNNVALGSNSMGTSNEGSNNVAIGHNSLATMGRGVAPSDVVVGRTYKIHASGNTDFTLIGAANNTIGTIFTATGTGVGTGTVLNYPPSTANTGIGNSAGPGFYDGSNNVFIGASVDSSTPLVDNEINIGNSSNNRLRIVGLGIDWTTTTKPPTITSVPSTSTSAGTVGQIAFDNDYFYTCVATNTWRRFVHTTW